MGLDQNTSGNTNLRCKTQSILAVVGAFAGRGRRGGTYGALLLAAYDEKDDVSEQRASADPGSRMKDLAKLLEMLEKYKINHRHPRVDSKIVADTWFVPGLVLEVIGAEITLSPIHTCGMNSIRPGAGLAIRFPRFTGNYRLKSRRRMLRRRRDRGDVQRPAQEVERDTARGSGLETENCEVPFSRWNANCLAS